MVSLSENISEKSSTGSSENLKGHFGKDIFVER
jgi:hypothetical protein